MKKYLILCKIIKTKNIMYIIGMFLFKINIKCVFNFFLVFEYNGFIKIRIEYIISEVVILLDLGNNTCIIPSCYCNLYDTTSPFCIILPLSPLNIFSQYLSLLRMQIISQYTF